jgi:Tfp pilus assembly protein PilF
MENMLPRVNIPVNTITALCFIFCVLFLYACATAPSSENLNQAEAHNKLGYSYFGNGQLNEAYTEFQKAIALNPMTRRRLTILDI